MEGNRYPSDVDEEMEGHAGLQSAERHEMEAVIEEEQAEESADGAESEEKAAESRAG